MKKYSLLFLTFLSIGAYARHPGPPHMSEEMKACFSELKSSGQMSEECQALMKKEDDRRAKIEACIQSIDSDVPADPTDTNTTTTSTTTATTDSSAADEE